MIEVGPHYVIVLLGTTSPVADFFKLAPLFGGELLSGFPFTLKLRGILSYLKTLFVRMCEMLNNAMVRYPAGVRGFALLGVLALGLAVASCGPVKSPPAVTPILDTVLDRMQPERPALAADDGSAYGVLPRTSVLIRVRAPWPGDLVVRVNGIEINRVAWSDQSAVPDQGRFAFDVVDPNPSPPVLLLRVDLPLADRSALRVMVEVASKSLDAANQGSALQSAFMPVTLTRTREKLEWNYANLSSVSLVTGVALTAADRLVIVARDLPTKQPGGTDALDPAPSLIHASLIYRIGGGPWLQGARSTAPGNLTRGSAGNVELGFNVPSGASAPRSLNVWMLVWRAVGARANDPDDDLLNDAQEAAIGTNPLVADTDADGLIDGLEVRYGTNPLVNDRDLMRFFSSRGLWMSGSGAGPGDTDGDGLADDIEKSWRFPPPPPFAGDPDAIFCYRDRAYFNSWWELADTDFDGLSDGEEVLRFGSEPGLIDTDRDRILDPEEVIFETDPRRANLPPPGIIRVPVSGNRLPDC